MKLLQYLFIASFLSYAYMAAVVMPKAGARIQAAAKRAECAKVLDLYMQGFTLKEVNASFDCMGMEGLLVYFAVETHEDAIYPLSYASFLGLGIFLFASFTFRNKKLAIALAGLPLLAMLADYAENIAIINLINGYPHLVLNESEQPIASIFNQLKWMFAFASMGLFVAVGIWALIKRLSQKRKVA